MTRNISTNGRVPRIACFLAVLSLSPLPGLQASSATLAAVPTATYKVYVGYADALRPSAQNFPNPWAGNSNVVYVGCDPTVCGPLPSGNFNPRGVDSGAIQVLNTSLDPETVEQVEVIFGGGTAPCVYDLLPSSETISPGESLIANESTGGGGVSCNQPAGTMDSSDLGIDGTFRVGKCSQSAMVPRIKVTVNNSTASYTDRGQVLNTGGVDLGECTIAGRLANEAQQWVPVGQSPGCGTPVLSLTPGRQTLAAPRSTTVVAHLRQCGRPLPNATVHLSILAGPNSKHGPFTPEATRANGKATFTYPYLGTGTGKADILQAQTTTIAGTVFSNDAVVRWANTITPSLQLSVTPTSPLSPRHSGGPEVYSVTLTGNRGTPRGTVSLTDGFSGRCRLTFSGRTGTTTARKCRPITESTAASPYNVSARFTPARGNPYKTTTQKVTIAGQATDASGTASTTVINPIGSGGITVTGTGDPHLGSVTATQYSANPTRGIPDGTNYFDVSVTSGFRRVVLQDCEYVTASTTLAWWNAKTGRWRPVVGKPASSLGGVLPCRVVTINATSSPTISQLNGTIFASTLAQRITSGPEESGYVGKEFSFTITTSGTPTPKLTEHGALLPGLRFADQNNGTATISGTMPRTPQSTTVTVEATFGRSVRKIQRLTIVDVGNTTLLPRPIDIVGFGSETIQNVFDQLSADYNRGVSALAPHLYSDDATGSANLVSKDGCPSEPRPNGSSAGILAAAGGPLALSANLKNHKGGTGFCTDFARSSRAPAVGDPSNIRFVPFGRDAVTWATNAGSNAPANLSLAQLRKIYTCVVTRWSQVGGRKAPIDAQLPQTSSGTREFFLTALGGGHPITPGPCVDSGANESPKNLPPEDEGVNMYLRGPNVIYPYSVADWISQVYHSPACAQTGCPIDPRTGTVDCQEPRPHQNLFGCDVHGNMRLGRINGTSPTAIIGHSTQLNPKFTPAFVHDLFVVVRLAGASPGGVPKYLQRIFGPNGWLFKSSIARADILAYGFRPRP